MVISNLEFRIADTFTDSLGRLTGDEQKAVKTTAFDLQLDPKSPGLQFHRIERAKDKNFWSIRVSRDLRLIVHKTDQSLLLCFVDHHNKAYEWAEKRKLQTHPKTGAAQLVEIRETVQEVILTKYVVAQSARPTTSRRRLFEQMTDDELLSFGVPAEWIEDVRAADDESIFALADHLPGEAAEALLELATGGKPRIPQTPSNTKDPFDHPDAQRRFRGMANVEELAAALDFPWEKWAVFLHPEQRQWVDRDYNGPARVSGSAGTGKTIVALHRAVHLARTNPESRVLLTTFSDVLAGSLRNRLRCLVSHEPSLMERMDVYSMTGISERLYKMHIGPVTIASRELIEQLLVAALQEIKPNAFSRHFLLTEWEQVVDAWQLGNWEAYRDVSRLGRKTRLPETQRKILWSVFERVMAELSSSNRLTPATIFSRLTDVLQRLKTPPFHFAVVDEAQDIGVSQMRFLSALGGDRSNALFFAGDLGQRIFQQPFSWKSMGVDIRGRSRTLRINYRTSHQIRNQADRLLGVTSTDVDGNSDDRSDTISVFNGPLPMVKIMQDEDEEIRTVADWISEQSNAGVMPHEFGVFVRSDKQLARAKRATEKAKIPWVLLDDKFGGDSKHLLLSTMHVAKGLEFRAVVVMACDDEVIPLQERIESIGDEADLQEVYDTERHLLYVACTRAREFLLVTGVKPVSEFLDDLRS